MPLNDARTAAIKELKEAEGLALVAAAKLKSKRIEIEGGGHVTWTSVDSAARVRSDLSDITAYLLEEQP